MISVSLWWKGHGVRLRLLWLLKGERGEDGGQKTEFGENQQWDDLDGWMSVWGRDEWTSAPMKSATVFDEFDKRHSSIENKLVNLAKALSKKSKMDQA